MVSFSNAAAASIVRPARRVLPDHRGQLVHRAPSVQPDLPVPKGLPELPDPSARRGLQEKWVQLGRRGLPV